MSNRIIRRFAGSIRITRYKLLLGFNDKLRATGDETIQSVWKIQIFRVPSFKEFRDTFKLMLLLTSTVKFGILFLAVSPDASGKENSHIYDTSRLSMVLTTHRELYIYILKGYTSYFSVALLPCASSKFCPWCYQILLCVTKEWDENSMVLFLYLPSYFGGFMFSGFYMPVS